jgi:hypothetical protein
VSQLLAHADAIPDSVKKLLAPDVATSAPAPQPTVK